MKDTNIEWAHHTFNPWIGCSKVSPGCKHCYADSLNARHKWAEWGPDGKRKKTSDNYWKQPRQWNAECKKKGIRQRVFCASLADVFEDHPDVVEWRYELFEIINSTPNLDWLILTKRPEFMRDFFLGESGMGANAFDAGVWDNLWLGTSAENQATWDERVPVLMEIPARVRFVSAEPLLGPIYFNRCYPEWVIVGGESGPNARPMHSEWVREIRFQCGVLEIDFFFKQWGEWTPGENVPGPLTPSLKTAEFFEGDWHFGFCEPEGHRDDEPDLYRVGKKKAGRMLDGELHNAIPHYLEGV